MRAYTDVISGAPRQLRRAELPVRLTPVPRRELVMLGQTAEEIYGVVTAPPTAPTYAAPPAPPAAERTPGRGIWRSFTVNATSNEGSQAVQEMNRRNIWGQSQAETVSPDEALRWGVDVALAHIRNMRQGFDRSRPYAGTIRYTTRQYLDDKTFIETVRYAIGGARYAVTKPKSADVRNPAWSGHVSRMKANLPRVYEGVIKVAMGLT